MRALAAVGGSQRAGSYERGWGRAAATNGARVLDERMLQALAAAG